MLKQSIAVKKAIKFDKTNLYKISIKNQLNKFEEIKKLIYKKRLI